MVTHAGLQVLHAHLAIGDNPKRHVFRIRVFAQRPGKPRAHILEMIEEGPNTSFTKPAALEIGESISQLPGKVLILAGEPSLLAGELHHVLGIHHVLLVLHVKLTDTALVRMGANSVIGHSQSYPHYFLAAGTLPHHLHNPSLVGVADGKCLAAGAITIGLHQACHHLDGLSRGLGTLQGDINEAAVIYQSRGVYHLWPSAIGGLANGDLVFIDIAYHVVGLLRLGNLAQVLIGVPVPYCAHGSLGMLARGIMAEVTEHAIVVRVVGTHDRPIHRGLLAHDEIGASPRASRIEEQGERGNQEISLTHIYMLLINI